MIVESFCCNFRVTTHMEQKKTWYTILPYTEVSESFYAHTKKSWCHQKLSGILCAMVTNQISMLKPSCQNFQWFVIQLSSLIIDTLDLHLIDGDTSSLPSTSNRPEDDIYS